MGRISSQTGTWSRGTMRRLAVATSVCVEIAVNSLEQSSLPPRDRPDTHTETHDPSYHLNMMLTLHHPLICVVFGPSFVSLPKEKISMKRNKNKRQYVGKCKRPPSAPHLI